LPDRRDKKKRPKAKNPPGKISRNPSAGAADPDAAGGQSIRWRLGRMDFAGDWSWGNLDREDLAELHREVTYCETATIRSLRTERKLKDVPIEAMCPEAQNRLAQIEQEDIDALTQLRLREAKRRAWGVLDGADFHVIWWDPSHTVATGKDRARVRSKE